MKLTFVSSYLSISSFPEIDLPDFTLLTGRNGAGKTHLLQALQNGNVRADCAPNPTQGTARFYDFNSMIPQDTGVFTTETLRSERIEAFQHFSNAKQQSHLFEGLRNAIRTHGLPDEYLHSPLKVVDLVPDDLTRWGIKDPATAYNQVQSSAQAIDGVLLTSMQQHIKQRIQAIAKATGKHRIATLTQDDFYSSTTATWEEIGIFQQSFGRLFVSYRDALLANDLAEFRATKGDQSSRYLPADEFKRLHGDPPWTFVNNALSTASLSFRINHPILTDYSPFQPELTKLSTGVRIPFSALSSGEKILMAFAFCVYYSNDKRQLASPPKLLLLDEVDAPLHPSMARNLINTIQQTLIAGFGIKVIMTTHSPSTVALAPEESVYVMEPTSAGIQKCSRSEALNILTVGVPTLSISYEGRRQIFVESPSDAKSYDAVYKILKSKIRSERSLEFVATGARSKGGIETNTGCDTVRRIVADLSSAGNQSVFGLLDWDGRHTTDQRIAVLAEGRRNGLENVIFDPLAIALLISRDAPNHRGILGTREAESFLTFAQLDPATMQIAINNVTAAVLGNSPDTTTRVEYIGGLALDVDERYLRIDDHQLETKLVDTFPFLHALSKRQAGVLLQHVIVRVFGDVPGAIPMELHDVFVDLLDRPSH